MSSDGFYRECPDCGYDEANCACEEFEDEWACTHCSGEGICDENNDPLWDCDDRPHRCHACNGSGKRRDQVIF